jgi:hypothetical protein
MRGDLHDAASRAGVHGYRVSDVPALLALCASFLYVRRAVLHDIALALELSPRLDGFEFAALLPADTPHTVDGWDELERRAMRFLVPPGD